MELHPILERLQALQFPGDTSGRRAAAHTRAAPESAFAAQGRQPATDLRVHVEGVGWIDAPLSADAAARLQQASRPARYGRRDRTLLDPEVRHTGEIGAQALTIDWPEGGRSALLRQVAQALGSGPLEARPHALLVYGPGQFFKPHQDTEKHEGMVGTLVLAWPSAHIGGRLVVRHRAGEFTFASQQLGGTELRWCAFYSDCRHEVLPVEEGWRVALTFDLVVAEQAPAGAGSPAPDAALQRLLREEFGLDGPPRLEPWALLLDHEYTEHGLRWHLLKGPDRERVGALRAAAQALGLSLHLALAEMHETWSAHVDGGGWDRRSRTGANPEPDELIERSLVLDYWVDADGRVGPRHALAVTEEQLNAFTDTDEAYLVDEQYEGYMGNWGETLEYWYRRAALVVQTPAAAERTGFVLDPLAALGRLQALARDPGRADVLAAQVSHVRDLLVREGRPQDAAWLQPCAEIAAALPDADQARALMVGFAPASFTPVDAPALARLQAGRGVTWLQALWDAWAQEATRSERRWPLASGGSGDAAPRRRGPWPEPLPEFASACLAVGLAPTLLERVLGVHALDALARADSRRAGQTPAQRQESLPGALDDACALVAALQAVPAARPHLERLLDHVAAHPRLYPATELLPLVMAAGGAASRWPVGGPLRERVVAALQAALAQAPREPDDYAVRGIEWTCACADCVPVRRWAESPTAQPLVLAMAELRRRHVVEALQQAAAPITGQTLRQGSPHKLLLDKAADLHEREAERRRLWSAWLAGAATGELPPAASR